MMDNWNMHTVGSLYIAFPKEKATRLVNRCDIYDTPKPGSGLTMAAIKLNVLSRQCLNRPIRDQVRDQATLCSEVTAWQVVQHGNVKRIE